MMKMVNKSNLVVKGQENNSEDANIAAKRQQQKIIEQIQIKKSKLNNFMNITKINASKLSKETAKKSNQQIIEKKNVLEKQKELKNKYTIFNRKDQTRNLSMKPVKVEWKQADIGYKKLILADKKISNYEQDSQNSSKSQIDSEIQGQKIQNPQDLLQSRQNIRNLMLKKIV